MSIMYIPLIYGEWSLIVLHTENSSQLPNKADKTLFNTKCYMKPEINVMMITLYES